MVANFSKKSGSLIPVTKDSPCPHCGKPDWCYSIGELSVCNRDNEPATGWEATNKKDADGHTFYARPQEKKPVRPKQTRHWEYPDRDGSPLVRVERVDDGEGNKKVWQQHWDKNKKTWVYGLGDVARASIPIYRRAEVLKAIAKGEPIFSVDGEQCADMLWKLGLAATTSIGGMGKFSLTDSLDLQGAKVVIVPDRDEPGVKDAEKVAQHFPDAKWLYSFSEKTWEKLPKSDGLDIFDWIERDKLSADDIKAAIGEKKVFKAPTPPAESKVVRPAQFQVPDVSELGTEIDALLTQDLKRSQLRLKISELAQKYRIPPKEIEEIYRLKQEESEEEANQEDTAAEVARLLSSQKAQLELSEILPVQLAAPIEKLAAKLNLKTEVYLAALLTQVSSLFKVGSEVLLRRDTDYRCTPNYFAGNVSESSQKKSPVVKAIIDRPMQSLREKAREEYQKALADYEEEYRQWKAAKGENKGLPPKEPRQRLYSFSKTTGEGILYQVAAYPDQALMYRCDELAGMFKSANQYRGGKGSDEEDFLEFWNGTGSTVLRASGVKADVDGLLLSVFGTIQPDVLATLLKDCSDSNGKFARFDFVFQPLAASKLPEEDNESFDLTPMLSSLYTKIDALAALKMELAPEAKRLFTAFYNATEERRVAEPKQGMRAMIGKMPEKVGKMAAIIHTLTCAFNGVEVSLQIPKSAVEAAIKFVKFSADQIASLYAEFSDRTALAPSLAKIVLLAERKGGTLTVRDCQKSFDSKKRPNAQQVKSWFKDLALMNYGAVVDSNKTSSFVITAPSVTNAEKDLPHLKSLHSKGSKDNWGNTGGADLPQLESLHSKGSEPSVTNCHYILQPSEIQGLKQPEFVEDEKTLFPHSPTVTDVSNADTALVQDLPQSEKIAPPVVTDVKTDAEELIAPTEQPIAPQPKKSKPEIKIGDRVVIARSDSSRYRGVKGEVIDDCWGANGLEFYIRFDKKISNILQDYFPAADVMREPC